ncbi:uncharacterized protein L203_104216 [Cryptococcus depauperatus CBS 7841]|uniref:separase n=1 Tax=Cryptococcus depauperatus CBS 7841 TaxID=1295531 RepID=A0AAJ8JV18_9TREE
MPVRTASGTASAASKSSTGVTSRTLEVTQDEIAAGLRKLAISKTESRAHAAKAQRTTGRSNHPEPARAYARARVAAPLVKGKEKAKAKESFPWASSTASETLKPADRAVQAMQAVNASIKLLGEAERCGFQYGSQLSAAEKHENEWTDEKIERLTNTCRVGFRVLRELNEDGVLGNKGVEVERSCLGMVTKYLCLGMINKAMETLLEARPALKRLYQPMELEDDNILIPIKAQSSRATTVSRSTTRTVSKTATSRSLTAVNLQRMASRNAPPGTSKDQAVPEEWMNLTWLPAAKEGSDISEPVKGLLFSAMISAWVGLLRLTQGLGTVISFMRLPSLTSSNQLNPLSIAFSLSRTTCTPALFALYRTISALALPTNSAAFFHLRHLALIALTLTITTAPDSKNTPNQLWETTHRTVASAVSVDGDGDRLKEAANLIDNLVNWASALIETREENKASWFSGKGWSGLMDIWIAVSRRLGEPDMIDRALSLMTASISISPVSSTSERSWSPAQAVDDSAKPIDSAEEITRIRGDLAKASLAFDKVLDSPTPPRIVVIDGLFIHDLTLLGQIINGLPHNDESRALVDRALRAWERVRRCCVKVLDRHGSDDEWQVFTKEVEEWSKAAITFAEIVAGRIEAEQALAMYLVAGTIDTIILLSQRSSCTTHSLLERGYVLYERTRRFTQVSDQIGWLRCLSGMAFNVGGKLYTLGKATEAMPLVKASCNWAVEALSLDSFKNDEENKGLQQLKEGLSRRWEFLAGCCQKNGEKEAIFAAYIECLSSQPPSLLAKLSAASSQPLCEIFESFTDFNNTLHRISAFIFFDPTIALGFGSSLVKSMLAKRYEADVVGAVGERVMEALEEGAWKSEVAGIALDLGENLLSVYSDIYPVRKLRVISRMMYIIVSSGHRLPHFEHLCVEAERLSTTTKLVRDVSLSVYRKEYEAYVLILKALRSYHLNGDQSHMVIEIGKKAVQALREIILPPTPASVKVHGQRNRQPLGRAITTRAVSSRPTRSIQRTVSEPQRKATGKVGMEKSKLVPADNMPTLVTPSELVFDDLTKLTKLLGCLSSLLGLLGQDLAQIEILRLLRAFERNCDHLINDYVRRSSQLATQYHKLGKIVRAGLVFAQTYKAIMDSSVIVDSGAKVEMLLQWVCYLAATGNIVKARDIYTEARTLGKEIETIKGKSHSLHSQIISRCDTLERAAWARCAVAAISTAQDNATEAIMQLSAAFRLWTRASDTICRIAETDASTNKSPPDSQADDPFTVKTAPYQPSGADEPTKDDVSFVVPQATHFSRKHLDYLQWQVASGLLDVTFHLASAFAARGSVKDVEYFLKVAGQVSVAVKSGEMGARTGAKEAEILFRLRRYGEVEGKLENAAALLCWEEGPEVVNLLTVQGDLYTRQQMVDEAARIFENTSNKIAGLDAVFTATEALLPSPQKKTSLNSSRLSNRALPSKQSSSRKEPLLSAVLAHVLQQHAWLLREAGSKKDCEQLLIKIKNLPSSPQTRAEELILQGNIALHEAVNQFKTDLFMSSLTESAVTMPMGISERKVSDRQSTRLSIQTTLSRAEDAFLLALEMVSGIGKVESIRQACLALALLKAFQTSLGQGTKSITSSAASILASSPAITLHREFLQAIECKFFDITDEDSKWPILESSAQSILTQGDLSEDLTDHDGKLRSYWNMIKTKYADHNFFSVEDTSLDDLPSNWAVISINVSDDRNTMFISRHQKGHEPIVFCLPLDRQGKREGDDDIWTFDAAVEELETIIKASNEGARKAKSITTQEGKAEWWAERRALDKRMEELCFNLEFVWLGAFKTILNPKGLFEEGALEDFRDNLNKVFQPILSNGRNKSKKTSPNLLLDDALLECFASLSSKCKEDEIEDLVYFILDIYQFHGVPVALSELDIDAIGVDVKNTLERVESKQKKCTTVSDEEHLFLALDRNVQGFPWESIPILRGRPISRIPSLSFLIDQVAMGDYLRPSLSQSIVQTGNLLDKKRTVNSRRTFYILNPSGDLTRTEAHFKPWIDEMVKNAGWKGIVGRPPTELEMKAALREYDLVLYFGHGGAEQYISSHKIRALPQCATTMLWGCSSGHLKDQGDFDRTGTAWHYMMAGCPSLIGNLWDVTDRDIDRLSEHVLKQSLHLDISHQPHSKTRPKTMLPLSELSTVQAVNKARNKCKLKYLNGAAPVVYGLPVYLH